MRLLQAGSQRAKVECFLNTVETFLTRQPFITAAKQGTKALCWAFNWLPLHLPPPDYLVLSTGKKGDGRSQGKVGRNTWVSGHAGGWRWNFKSSKHRELGGKNYCSLILNKQLKSKFVYIFLNSTLNINNINAGIQHLRYSPSILVPLLELQFSPAVSTSLRDFPHFQLSIPAPSPASHPRVCKGTARAAAEKLGNVMGEPPSSGNANDGAHPHGHQQAHRYFSSICAPWYFLVKPADLLPRHGAQERWTCLTWMLLTLPTCELVSQEEIVAFSFHNEDWKNGLTWNC